MPSPIKTEFTHRFPERPEPVRCAVSLGYRPVNGRIEVRDMTVVMLPEQKLDTSLLRRLPLGAWINEDRRRITNSAKWTAAASIDRWSSEDMKLLKRLASARVSSRGRPPLSDATLKEVAVVYRAAYGRGEYPTKAVQEHFTLSRSTAGRWVERARAQGYLGQTIERQAGEHAPTTVSYTHLTLPTILRV